MHWLFGVITVFWLWQLPAQLRASELPLEAPQQLNQILSAPEFQPRALEIGWRERVGQYLLHHAQEILQRLDAWTRERSDAAWLPGWLKNIVGLMVGLLRAVGALLGQLAQVLTVVLLLAVLWMIVRVLYRFVRPYFEQRLEAAPIPTGAPELSAAELRTCFNAGQYTRLLEGLRILLRREIERRFALPDGLTDREIMAAAPAGVAELPLLRDASTLFERGAFCGEQIDQNAVVELFGRFSRAEERR